MEELVSDKVYTGSTSLMCWISTRRMVIIKCSSLTMKCAIICSVIVSCVQCQVCEEGVEVHAQVRPDSMKGLHQRMEELLQDYR